MNDDETIDVKSTEDEILHETLHEPEVSEIAMPVQAVVAPHEGTLEEQVASLKGAVAFLASKLPGGYEEIKNLFPHLNLQ